MVAKKKTTKKQAKPKTKIVYRTKKVYVEKEEDDNPFKQTNQMIGTGMAAVVGLGMAGAIAKAFK
jgi:hypothetical protein